MALMLALSIITSILINFMSGSDLNYSKCNCVHVKCKPISRKLCFLNHGKFMTQSLEAHQCNCCAYCIIFSGLNKTCKEYSKALKIKCIKGTYCSKKHGYTCKLIFGHTLFNYKNENNLNNRKTVIKINDKKLTKLYFYKKNKKDCTKIHSSIPFRNLKRMSRDTHNNRNTYNSIGAGNANSINSNQGSTYILNNVFSSDKGGRNPGSQYDSETQLKNNIDAFDSAKKNSFGNDNPRGISSGGNSGGSEQPNNNKSVRDNQDAVSAQPQSNQAESNENQPNGSADDANSSSQQVMEQTTTTTPTTPTPELTITENSITNQARNNVVTNAPSKQKPLKNNKITGKPVKPSKKPKTTEKTQRTTKNKPIETTENSVANNLANIPNNLINNPNNVVEDSLDKSGVTGNSEDSPAPGSVSDRKGVSDNSEDSVAPGSAPDTTPKNVIEDSSAPESAPNKAPKNTADSESANPSNLQKSNKPVGSDSESQDKSANPSVNGNPEQSNPEFDRGI